uniref:Uncharacterized protein n=1 Tax=Timema shepardi TaxID=629360 RepID=A0A7R9AMG4_TIMSH|nr:unnamed protein product [Timema shepardi]
MKRPLLQRQNTKMRNFIQPKEIIAVAFSNFLTSFNVRLGQLELSWQYRQCQYSCVSSLSAFVSLVPKKESAPFYLSQPPELKKAPVGTQHPTPFLFGDNGIRLNGFPTSEMNSSIRQESRVHRVSAAGLEVLMYLLLQRRNKPLLICPSPSCFGRWARKKEQAPADLSQSIVFRPPELKRVHEDDAGSGKRRKSKAVNNKTLLSFDEEEHDDS